MTELGCGVCLEEGYGGGPQPRFVGASSPGDLLYRCEVCGTWWIGNERARGPVSAREASDRFPDMVTP